MAVDHVLETLTAMNDLPASPYFLMASAFCCAARTTSWEDMI
jgi:hypothetical protein